MFYLGDFCRDLSSHGDIQNVIMDSFASPNEEVKTAASYALGKFFSLSLCRTYFLTRSFTYACIHAQTHTHHACTRMHAHTNTHHTQNTRTPHTHAHTCMHAYALVFTQHIPTHVCHTHRDMFTGHTHTHACTHARTCWYLVAAQWRH